MARQMTSRYLLLGLLDWMPMSGYDIKKTVENSIKDFWHESYGNIYPNLQKFVEQGLAERRVEKQEGTPDRIEYSITPAGREELLDWLKEPFKERRTRDVFLAKFIFGYLLSKESNIDYVESYRRDRERRLKWYRQTEAELAKTARRSRKTLLEFLALRQGVILTEARLKWCDEVLSALREYNDSKDGEDPT